VSSECLPQRWHVDRCSDPDSPRWRLQIYDGGMKRAAPLMILSLVLVVAVSSAALWKASGSRGTVATTTTIDLFAHSAYPSNIPKICNFPDLQTQSDMNWCGSWSANVAEKQLIAELARAPTFLNKSLLRQAEAQWEGYRAAECALEQDFYSGGSIQPTIYNDCLTRLTDSRVAQLKAYFAQVSI